MKEENVANPYYNIMIFICLSVSLYAYACIFVPKSIRRKYYFVSYNLVNQMFMRKCYPINRNYSHLAFSGIIFLLFFHVFLKYIIIASKDSNLICIILMHRI